MTMPNFLILGAGRSGTTSLYYYLKQHPQVYMSPIKETNYFAMETRQSGHDQSSKLLKKDSYPINNIQMYMDLFKGVSDQKAIGEASPIYLWSPTAAEEIYHAIPKAKLIVVLRHPVERAYSGYLKYVRDDWERRSFTQAIHDEELGVANNALNLGQQFYVGLGFYYEQLTRYFNLFDRAQIAVYLYDDFIVNPAGTVRDVFRFLDVDDEYVPDMSIKYNASGRPKNRVLHTLLQSSQVTKRVKQYLPDWLIRAPYAYFVNAHRKNLFKPTLSPELRQKLLTRYHQDTLKLQELIQRDLSAWLV